MTANQFLMNSQLLTSCLGKDNIEFYVNKMQPKILLLSLSLKVRLKDVPLECCVHECLYHQNVPNSVTLACLRGLTGGKPLTMVTMTKTSVKNCTV